MKSVLWRFRNVVNGSRYAKAVTRNLANMAKNIATYKDIKKIADIRMKLGIRKDDTTHDSEILSILEKEGVL